MLIDAVSDDSLAEDGSVRGELSEFRVDCCERCFDFLGWVLMMGMLEGDGVCI